MTSTKLVQRLCLLALALVLGHGLLVAGRIVLFERLGSSYGSIGVDHEGRVRHWRRLNSTDQIEFLSADDVARGERIDEESWSTDKLLAEFIMHFRSKQLVARHSDMAAALHLGVNDPGRHWTRYRVDGAWARVSGGLDDDSDYDYFLLREETGTAVNTLMLRPDGAAFVRVTVPKPLRRESKITTREFPIEPPLSRATVQQHGEAFGDFVGIVGDTYWIIAPEGTVKQRQPLTAPYDDVSHIFTHRATRGFLVLGAQPRPDHMPVRLIVAQRGEPLMTHDVAFEPTTPFQRALSFGFGVLACMRPAALNLAASGDRDVPSVEDMQRRWWLDPLFNGGANRPWLVASLLVTLCSALVAWRWARVRAAGCEWFWVGAALLLGPTGLVWMRLALPWAAIEGGRAVNMEPPNWPEPALVGTEVISA